MAKENKEEAGYSRTGLADGRQCEHQIANTPPKPTVHVPAGTEVGGHGGRGCPALACNKALTRPFLSSGSPERKKERKVERKVDGRDVYGLAADSMPVVHAADYWPRVVLQLASAAATAAFPESRE